jgi:hypothetical protein
MDGKMYGFKPGEKVWVRGQNSSEYLEATIAPLDRQAAYQAKRSWQEGSVVVMRSATGLIGKPVFTGRLLHDSRAVRTYVDTAKAEKKARDLVRHHCATEGLVLGGKLCRQSPLWQTFVVASLTHQQAEEALRTQIISAKPQH